MEFSADPHEVLEVDPGASEAEIERAYRERVKEAHPDHGGSTWQFKLVRTAYEELTTGSTEGRRARRTVGDVQRRRRDRTDGPSAGTDRRATTGGDRQAPVDVEFLDYQVVADRGWAITDDDLFDRAASQGLDAPTYGRLRVDPEETLLEAAESSGLDWPFSCRGGACANCAVAVVEGDVSMSIDHVLPDDLTDQGIRLACIGASVTGGAKIVYNVKYMPELEELLLPPRPGTGSD